jgi:hypothetical protein
MFGTDFGKKCIIMHFLGEEKDGKSAQRSPEVSGAEARRKDLRKEESETTAYEVTG